MMNWVETKAFLSPFFPEELQSEMDMLLPGELREIRIRAERSTVFVTGTRSASLSWTPGRRELEALIEALSEHSLYARSSETGQGYLTLRGGHRLGLCGRAIVTDKRSVLSDIGSVCIRIAGEWPGTANPLLERVAVPCSLLIIGAPGTGKTTLLRDLARQFSSGHDAVQTAIIDERSELAACVNGIPQLDVGQAVDVLDGLPKTEALPWLIRSMSPQMIITDEIGDQKDAEAIMEAASCGSAICASVHGATLQDTARRPALAALMSRRIFDYYIVLSSEGGGRISAMYDRTGNPVTIS